MSSLCIYLYSRDTPPQQWPGPQVPPVPDLHWHSDLMWRGTLSGLHQSWFTVRGKNPPSVPWGWGSGNGGGRENWLPSLTSKWEKRLCFLRNNHQILVTHGGLLISGSPGTSSPPTAVMTHTSRQGEPSFPGTPSTPQACTWALASVAWVHEVSVLCGF